MRIGVLGICDAGGMTTALRFLLPNAVVTPIVGDIGVDALSKSCDLLVVNDRQVKRDLSYYADFRGDKVVYPHLAFSAYHPDLVYVKPSPELPFIDPPYNSRIICWCYLNKIPHFEVKKLFSDEVFSRLGYFEMWEHEANTLSDAFAKHNLDFASFFLDVKRHGAFMHSINHPRLDALFALAKCISAREGWQISDLGSSIPAIDTLAVANWPLYPEVAQHYGIYGRYQWRIGDVFLGLEDYICWAYARYEQLGLRAGMPELHAEHKGLDVVLGELLW